MSIIKFIVVSILFTSLTSLSAAQEVYEVYNLYSGEEYPTQDRFGRTIAQSDKYIVVGSPEDDYFNDNRAGSVYLFDAPTGELLHELISPDIGQFFAFGASVAVIDDIVIVASLGSSEGPSGSITKYDALTGKMIDRLVPMNTNSNDRYGFRARITGNILAISAHTDDNEQGAACGAVYLYHLNTFEEISVLIPKDGQDFYLFGYAIDLSEDYLVVGTFDDDHSDPGTGFVYVYEAQSLELIHKITPPDRQSGDEFGTALAISGDTLVVGARRADTIAEDSGKVYVYDIPSGDMLGILTPSDLKEGDVFGYSVDMNDMYIVVGARSSSDASDNREFGMLYMYDRATLEQTTRLRARHRANREWLGENVLILGERVISGAPLNSDRGQYAGAVYVFEGPYPCSSADDSEPFGILNFFDVSAFLHGYLDEHPDSDLNDDTIFNFFDVTMFLQSFNMGCPN